MAKGSFFTYVKAAFLYHWNLLAIGAGTGAAFLSGKPDVILPLMMAGELLYLSVLSSSTRYQQLIDAINQLDAKEKAAGMVSKSSDQILDELTPGERTQFNKLQNLCLELKRSGKGDEFGIQEAQLTNMNKLLWIYLKLLYSKKSLKKFFDRISIGEIDSALEDAREKIDNLGPENEDTPRQAQYRRLVNDTYETLMKRRENYNRAREDEEFLGMEIKRLNAKISSIAEIGLSHSDPSLFTSEIDIVSSSVSQTEKTMHDLESLTGITFIEEETPSLIRQGQAEGPLRQ